MKRLRTARGLGLAAMLACSCAVYGCAVQTHQQHQTTIAAVELAADTGCHLFRQRNPEGAATVLTIIDTRVRPLLEVSHDPVQALHVIGGMASSEVPELQQYLRPALGLVQLYLESQGIQLPEIDPRYVAVVAALSDGCRAALVASVAM